MTSSCGSLQDANIGSVTGSATYDACDSDTISISANNVPSSTADKQYSVQREVCGDGEVIVHVLSVSGGLAGLELRASNAAGAIKVGLRTVLGTSVQRFVRTSTDGAQSSSNIAAFGHKWLKLVRSGSNVSTFTSTNGSTWNFAASYTVSLPTCVQASLLMQSTSVGATNTGVFKDLQFSSFTAPEGDTTTVSFDQDTIHADAGDTVTVCVNITNPCICSLTEVDVELQGSGSPHLSGYSTQTLTFADTTSQQCFSIPISEAAGSANYTLSLENPAGGNGAETETPASLIIAVTGIDDGSPLYCGVAPPMSDTSNLFALPVAFDRFGNKYFFYQLLPPIDTGFTESLTSQGLPGCDCNDVGITLNLFDLWFEDCFFNTGIGFDAPGELGEDRREVICATYQYLETLIVPGQTNCDPDPSPSKVNIRVQPSGPLADYYGSALGGFSPGTLGYSSAYYPEIIFFNPGIIFGIPQTIINSGEYPSSSFPNSMHGYIRINFNRNWYLDYTADPEEITPSTFQDPIHDLFTVCLHESLHILGFASAFNFNGNPLGSREGQGLYFPFDQFLGLDYDNDMSAETSLIKNGPVTPGFTGSPIWSFNNDDISNPGLHMHRSCLLGNPGPNMKFESNTGGSYPISTFNTFVAGSSFSHLDGACGILNPTPQQTIPYVMNPSLPRSTARRELHPHERDIMTAIGYNIGGNGCAIGSVDDMSGGNCSTFNFTLKICPPEPGTISIPLADLLLNDPGAESIAYIEPLIAGNGSGELSTEGTHYNFTVTRLGLTELVYAPFGCDGTLGNSSIISINVVPESDGDCPFYCEDFTTCAELEGNPLAGFCQENFPCVENSCNLICNGKICGTALASSSDILDALGVDDIFDPTHFRVWSIDGTNVNNSAGIVPGWISAGGTPDYIFESPTYENSILIGGQNHYTEGVMTFVDISPDKNYLLGIVTGWATPELHQNFLNIRLIAGENLIPGATSTPNNYPIYSGPIQTIFSANGDEHISEKYSQLFCFSPSEDDYNCIWFHNEWQAEIAEVSQSGSFIKDVELIEDDFSAGPDLTTALCYEPVNIGGKFCMLSDVGIKYEWFEITDDGQGNETLVPIASYRVFNNIITNITGDINASTHELTVAPPATTNYRLRRSVFFAPHFTTEPDLCILEDDMTISVNEPVPDASFSYSQNGCFWDFQSNDPTLGLIHEWDFGTVTTSDQMNPTGINLPDGEPLIIHTLTSQCGVDTYSETIPVELIPDVNLILVSEECGLATFSLTGLEPGNTWEIDYGDGLPLSTQLTNIYSSSGNYTATAFITHECGTVEIETSITATVCLLCEDCDSGNTIGVPGENTSLIDVIDSENLSENNASVHWCVAGTLIIDQNYNFINSTFLMKPGSRILIQDGKALSIGNSLIMGCEEMWRGIEVKPEGSLKMSGSKILDAQYAVYLHPAENTNHIPGSTVTSNTFGNNFVGLLIPSTPTGIVNLSLGDNLYYQSGVDLKHPYTTQTSTPESLPQQEDHALAGIIVHNQPGFGSYRNRFAGLTAGIVANRTLLAVDRNHFTGIRPYGNEYPNFAGRGIGIRADVNGSTTMAIGNTFLDCFVGISSNLTELTATGNTLTDVDWGILGSQISTGTISIGENTIENAKGSGIWVVHANPGGSVLIGNNTVNTDADANGVGIVLWSNNAPSTLQDNNITVKGTGTGIGMTSTSRATLLNNIVTLENADEARAGILLEHTSQSTFRDNSVSGFGTTGDANENIALEIASSPGNAYCCNTLGNTRLGVSVFGGSLTTDQFRGTTFGAHVTSLYLPNANAVLGTQTHTENCWQVNSGAAVYGVPFAFAQDYPFLVYEDANLCFKPTSHSPQGWFEDDENLSGPPDICATTICKTDSFKPDSDDVKRLTDGDTTLLPAVRWELQRYIYEKLLTEAPEDTTNEKFRDNVENTTIGFFQAINESIDAMFAADSVSRAALNANLILALGKLDSLILIDSLVTIEEDSSEIVRLMQTRGGLTEVLFDLALDNEDLTEEISDNFSDAADDIRAVNDTIAVIEDFEINEKVVNDLYLVYLAEADTSEIDTLEAIAAQCPLLGGNAVYRARALLAMMTGELISYKDSLNCSGSQSFSRPDLPTKAVIQTQTLQVFPNPATREVKVTWRQAILQSGTLVLYDLYGRKILELILGEGETSRTVALLNLPNSIYVLRLRLDGQDFARKISVKH